MVFVMPVPAVQYVKKEDVPEFINKYRLVIPIFLLISSVVLFILNWSVYPKINSMFNEFNAVKPLTLSLFPYIFTIITSVMIGLSLYYIFNKPDPLKIQNKLSKYKPGEMVNVKEFIDYKLQLFIFILIGISIAFIILSIVVPIYNLTNSY